MSDAVWITIIICATVLTLFWMSLTYTGGEEDDG